MWLQLASTKWSGCYIGHPCNILCYNPTRTNRQVSQHIFWSFYSLLWRLQYRKKQEKIIIPKNLANKIWRKEKGLTSSIEPNFQPKENFLIQTTPFLMATFTDNWKMAKKKLKTEKNPKLYLRADICCKIYWQLTKGFRRVKFIKKNNFLRLTYC